MKSSNPKVNFFWKKFRHSDVRQNTTKKILSSIGAILAALIIAIIIACSVCGTWKRLGDVLKTIFTSGFKSTFINSLFSNMSIMIVAGLAFIFAYKAGLFNIGISGQMVMGGTIATIICHKSGLATGANQIVVLIASMIAAAAVAALVGTLKAFLNVNEVVSSIMFNWIIYFLTILLLGSAALNLPKDSSGLNTAAPADNILFRIGPNSYVPLLIMAGLLVIIVFVIINYTVFGKKQKVVGLSRTGALAAGYNVKANMIASMAISGAIAGVLGVMLYCGFSPQMATTAAAKAIPQEGFDGISVGLIAMCNPIATLPVSLFFSMVKTSVSDLQMIGVDNHIAQVLFGIVVYGSAAIALFLNLKPYWWTIKLWKGARYSKIKHESDLANIALIEYASDYNAQLKKYYYYSFKQQHLKCALALTPWQKFKCALYDAKYKTVERKVKRDVNKSLRADTFTNIKYYRQDLIHIIKQKGKLVLDTEQLGRRGIWFKPTQDVVLTNGMITQIELKFGIKLTNDLIEKIHEFAKKILANPFNDSELKKVALLSYLQTKRTGLTYRYDIAKQNVLDKESLDSVDALEKSLGLPQVKTKKDYKLAYAAHVKAYFRVLLEIEKFYMEAYARYSPSKKLAKTIDFDPIAVKYDTAQMEKNYVTYLKEEIRLIRDQIDKPMFLFEENKTALAGKKGA